MKRLIGVLLAAVMLMAFLAACTPTETPTEPPSEVPPSETVSEVPSTSPSPSDESEDPGEPEEQELNIAIFQGGYGPEFWEEIIKRFEADNPGVTVNMQISPEIGDIIRPQIVAGDVPDFLNMNDNDQTGVVLSLIQDNGLLDITDVFNGPQYDSDAPLKDKIIDGFLESAKCAPYGDGKIYLGPSNAGPMGLVYNKNLFEQQGWSVPVTWDDFFALGDLAKAEGISLLTYQGIYPGYMESVLFPAIASKIGLEDFKKITSYQPGIWTDPRVVSVLEQFAKIYSGGYLMPGTVALNHTQSQTDQMNDKALFIPNGTWMENEMEDAERAEGYRFALTPPPVDSAGATRYIMSSVEQFSIPASAKNPELAKRFMRFIYTDDAIKLYAELCGAVMATNNALDLVSQYLTDGVAGMFGSYSEPNAAAIIVGFDAVPEGSNIVPGDEIFQPLSDVMTGSMTAQEWAESIDQAYQDIQAGR